MKQTREGLAAGDIDIVIGTRNPFQVTSFKNLEW